MGGGQENNNITMKVLILPYPDKNLEDMGDRAIIVVKIYLTLITAKVRVLHAALLKHYIYSA